MKKMPTRFSMFVDRLLLLLFFGVVVSLVLFLMFSRFG